MKNMQETLFYIFDIRNDKDVEIAAQYPLLC